MKLWLLIVAANGTGHKHQLLEANLHVLETDVVPGPARVVGWLVEHFHACVPRVVPLHNPSFHFTLDFLLYVIHH